MIPRQLEVAILDALQRVPPKVLVLFGPRQVGKTTLLAKVRSGLEGNVRTLNGDFLDDQALLRPERGALDRLVQGIQYLFIDEAQNFPDIGRCLKLLHDHHETVRVLATGSSSFDLARRTGEPLTGRQQTMLLYPVSYAERSPTIVYSRAVLESCMIHGSYPEVIELQSAEDKERHLRGLATDALLKDIFAHVDVNRHKLHDILRLLAHQIGNEVSLSEVARTVQVDTKTVARYCDLLEDAFVIVRLRGFSRNLRKEVGKSQKVYFMDLGIRNAIIRAFHPLQDRADVGALWENLMVLERIKRNSYANVPAEYFFWRTYDRQEIDLIEEAATSSGMNLRGFEFKWGRSRKQVPKLFSQTYPHARVEVVDVLAAHEFLLGAGAS
ncbi:MAG TPA: ATP-binding protein [Planctomycetota bacterium]|nr:ATP-binding protein [Planctomycetota bacterium]